jgi:2-keto-myo-inositol isomerase
VTIVSINALYPFNVWFVDLPSRAERLPDYAAAYGAETLVMGPLNDGSEVAHAYLVVALREMVPILRARGLTGLVEPLGFPISSLRTKAEAVSAIEETAGADVYRLADDAFHRHLAGETEFFSALTGLVHISGVVENEAGVDAMLDAHRLLVDGADRLGNLAQIRTLLDQGYEGPFSFEPFAAEVHARSDRAEALRTSMAHLSAGL